MRGKQEMVFYVEQDVERIKQERQKNRVLLTENKMEPMEFNKRDTDLIRELESLFIQRNVTNILF